MKNRLSGCHVSQFAALQKNGMVFNTLLVGMWCGRGTGLAPHDEKAVIKNAASHHRGLPS
jgi:hypothetical protein